MQHVVACTLVGVLALMPAGVASADPQTCQKKIVSQLLKLKKTHVKGWVKCLDQENVEKIPGPCLDTKNELKLDAVRNKVVVAIAASCTPADLTTLGYGSDCALRPATSAAETACAALPVTSSSELASCLACWKEAELSAYVATLYASHAVEPCDGVLDSTSTECAALSCTTPLPDQRDLGDSGENDCQRGIGAAGAKHLLLVEKTLEKCGLEGNTRAECLADPVVAGKLTKASDKLATLIQKKCGNRAPTASTPFCCRSGPGNACVAATTRDECELAGGDVHDNQQCGLDNTCDPLGGGGQKVTWWETCPLTETCGGPTLADLDDLIDCVDTSVTEVTDQLLCIQLPGGGWPCS